MWRKVRNERRNKIFAIDRMRKQIEVLEATNCELLSVICKWWSKNDWPLVNLRAHGSFGSNIIYITMFLLKLIINIILRCSSSKSTNAKDIARLRNFFLLQIEKLWFKIVNNGELFQHSVSYIMYISKK